MPTSSPFGVKYVNIRKLNAEGFSIHWISLPVLFYVISLFLLLNNYNPHPLPWNVQISSKLDYDRCQLNVQLMTDKSMVPSSKTISATPVAVNWPLHQLRCKGLGYAMVGILRPKTRVIALIVIPSVILAWVHTPNSSQVYYISISNILGTLACSLYFERKWNEQSVITNKGESSTEVSKLIW